METWIPAHDWILLEKHVEGENLSPGGIALPQPGDYSSLRQEKYKTPEPTREIEKNQGRVTGRFTVLAVGPGLYVDVFDDVRDNVFLRKPMSVVAGDVVLVQEGANPITVNGKTQYATHECNVLAKILDVGTPNERLDVLLDYVFARQAMAIRQSTGGIWTPQATDPTGNKALPDRWEVLGVGDGPWAVQQTGSKSFTFARRPMSVKKGDIFAFEGAGFAVVAAGAKMLCCQNYQIAGVFQQDNA